MYELDSWNRKWRTLWCWTHIYVHYKKFQMHSRNFPEELINKNIYCNHKYSKFAELLWRNIQELQIWWVKAGQFLSTRSDLFPSDYVSYLSKLQDNMPIINWKIIQSILNEELGLDYMKIFKDIEEKAIAASSISQVHKAELISGEKVVIKIQYPNVEEKLNQDMKNLEQLTWAFGLYEQGFDFITTLNDWQKSAYEELDLKNELKNHQKAYEMFNGSGIEIKIPKIYSKYSTNKILMIEYIQGFKISDKILMKKFHVNKKELLEILCDSFAYQIHIHGFFHADPQPSNIFVVYDEIKRKHIPAILDWGLIKIFDKKTQIAFSK